MNAVAPLIPCIVSGGSGTRLWPVSRESMPKPFMRLADDQSLLQKTFLRIAGLPDVARLLTVTNRDLLFRTLDDYRAVNRIGLAQDLLLEPVGRNTAPAIAAAALHVQEHFGDQAQLLILPADHLIRDEQAFAAAVAKARELAAQDYLVTFGITPERAETGFGYIEQGAPLGNGFRVARFVEKPDQATAQSYLDSGKYLWNAGMFCFQAATVLQELERHAPDVLIAARAALADGSSLENGQCRQRELAAGAFAEAPDISVDYALMERSDKVAVVPCSIGWSDIGSWQALRELSAADENGNQVRGESVLHDVSNCYIDSPKRLVGAVGVHDLIIVDTPDALLVADAARSQDVKFVAQELKRRGHDAFRLHRTVSRPWGTYTVLEEGRRFKIKRIVVRPKASLSLQMHHHRSEHWIVVSGMALVENGEREFLLNTNESTFIPAGHSHRLSNVEGQADYVLRRLALMSALDYDRIFLFTLSDLDQRASVRDRDYGLLDLDANPKPVYLALQRFLKVTGPKLRPADPPVTEDLPDGSFSIGWTREDGRHVWLFWSARGGSVRLPKLKEATLHDPLSGKVMPLSGSDGLEVPVKSSLQMLVWE
ncbi:mannose-1-phosphate guanylyltransferase/mannose-6-phosphate isomerase [Pseudomonas aeruginosa]|nr:mannose-1-phosphate guanylyltransferase/mannose-6-phosphate isomerase [Pseudomonas aeruginosa]MCO2357138.1 mannose-1-phosphate guanylyltransferase/mannose-6-phosphate isomerase [Pseudomonas aeruginosa]